MFENSLVESRIAPISSSKRWITVASIGLQLSIAAIVVALPLLHPEALPFHMESPRVMLPPPPKPPAPVVHIEHATSTSTSVALPGIEHTELHPAVLPGRAASTEGPPAIVSLGTGMDNSGNVLNVIGTGTVRPAANTSVAPPRASAKPVNVSSGVSQGMLLSPIHPIYPSIAKAAHIEGTVVVQAVISRTGTIESLHVLSGPAMLQSAAIDAIRAARYRPYKLNGEPTEVQTTFTVNFKIGG